jgi:hypothetical protein
VKRKRREKRKRSYHGSEIVVNGVEIVKGIGRRRRRLKGK